MSDRPMRLGIRFGLVLAASLTVLGFGILARLSAGFVLDDAFMFVRYADRLLADGRLAWNPGGESTYGPTSLLYLAVVLPIRALLSEQSALAAGLSSLVSGLAFLLLLAALLRRPDVAGTTSRGAVLVTVFLVLAASTPAVASHFVSGMDTAFALACLTGYILIYLRAERKAGRLGTVSMGIVGGLAFAARPDLLVYTLSVPTGMVVLGPDREARRRGVQILVLAAATVGAQILGTWTFLHSPLPLSFYAKGVRGYGEAFASHYRLVPFVQLAHYLGATWPFLAIIGLDLWVNRDRKRTRVWVAERALLAATCVFILYYTFFVLQIMHRPQRFYYPSLPALVFLAAQGIGRLAGMIRPRLSAAVERLPRWTGTAFTILLGGLLIRPALTAAVDLRREVALGRFLYFDVAANVADRYDDYWYELVAFSELPDDLVIATTEIGRPAALNPRKTIVDLTGLNDRTFAHDGFSAARVLTVDQPDLIYMPHPHYQEMATQLIEHPEFAARYDHFTASDLRAEMGIAIRRDSDYYRRMRAVVHEGALRRRWD